MSNDRDAEACIWTEQKANNALDAHICDHRNQSHRTLRIRALNDQLRCQGLGGRTMITRGIAAMPTEQQLMIAQAVRAFDGFSSRNDPWGEHDCATLDADGVKIIWKIDAYDRSLTLASADRADARITARVLTIMLADEY